MRANVKTLPARCIVLVAAAIGLTLGASCAEPETIDRVQPDLIEKSKLDGEWYILDTIVQVPYASHYAFPGLQGTLIRGVFEIEEDVLYFYRTYEFIEGLESQGIKHDTDTVLEDEDGNPVTYYKQVEGSEEPQLVTRYVFRSSPVGRWAISGHYDVRKQYNPLTGEESNVLVEDSSEKYWWQRDFMRVDFSNDTAGHMARFSYWPWYEDVIYDGETGADQFKFRIEDDGSYMDFVTRGFILAPREYLSGWGWVPTCLFYPWYTGSFYECNEEEMQIRTSFMRVDPQNTYIPWNYDDQMMNRFGYYRSSRATWDTQYGTTYNDAHRYIRRFRLWEDYIDADGDGTPEYAQMTPKPIVYYLSEDFPRELLPGAVDLADQWNSLFAETVAELSGRSLDEVPRMFVLCENNMGDVAEFLTSNPDALLAETESPCLDMEAVKYRGDLRYNLLVSVDEPVQYGLYGYGPMHSDPLTGEIIHANAFNYTANMRLGARNATDYVEYAAGVQSFRDVTQAEHIKSAMKAKALKGSSNDPTAMPMSLEGAMSMAEMVVTPDVQERLSAVGLQTTDTDMAQARMSRLLGADDFNWAWLNHDMAAMAGLPFTEFGVQPDEDGFLKDLVHPANMGTESMLHWRRNLEAERGKHAICMGEHFDDSFKGVAAQYKPLYDKAVCEGVMGRDDLVFDFGVFREPGDPCDESTAACGEDEICTQVEQGETTGKYCMLQCSTRVLLDQLRREIRRVNDISDFDYWDPNALYTPTKDKDVTASQIAVRDIIEPIREEVFWELFDRIWSTVAMHEVGHNVGLRHNFEGSTDALNYFPQYWDLKGVQTPTNGWHPNTLWTDETDKQVLGRIRETEVTSIMEYTASFNARWAGLGKYDRAAILFGYGGMLEVFDEAPPAENWVPYLDEPDEGDPSSLGLTPRREGPLGFALRKVHHTNIPNVFGGVDKMQARHVVKWQDIADTTRPCSMFDDPYDFTVCGDNPNSFCRPFPSGHFCTNPDNFEVPYRFCGDEYNWSSPTCQTHDEGTDSFERIRHEVNDYEEYWPFRGYKRDNDLFSPQIGYWNYSMYIMSFLRKHWEHWAYNYVRYNKGDWWEKKFGKAWHLDINGGLGATLAAREIFEMMASVFGRPSDAYYGWNDAVGRYEPVVNDGRSSYCNIFQVREDQGARPIYPGYDFSGYLYTPARAGTFYDRLAATMYMTYPQMLFVQGVDTAVDTRRFRMSFGSVWPQRTQNILAGLVTGEPATFGWCVEHSDPSEVGCDGEPIRVKRRKWFGTNEELDEHYTNCLPLTPEPAYTFPTTQYRLPAVALIYGMGWMQSTYDRSFSDRSRVWLEGEGNDLVVPEGFEVVEYQDPFSGKTYRAPYDPKEFDPYATPTPRSSVPNNDVDMEMHGHSYWPTARLLALANDELDAVQNIQQLTEDYQYSTLQQLVGRLEIIRGLYGYFEYGSGGGYGY